MNLRRYARWWVVLLVLLGAIVLVALVDCTRWYLAGDIALFGDPGASITYVNETDQPLQFYGQYSGKALWKDELVPQHSAKEVSWMITGPTLRIVAERPDGRKVFDKTYRWKEFRDDGRIVVFSLDPID